MRFEYPNLIFESGQQEYVNTGQIGISADCLTESSVAISYGADGSFGRYGNDSLTRDERTELADYMIGLWKQYKEMPEPTIEGASE